MAVKIVPVTDLRRAAANLLEEVGETGGPIYITHRSRPQGVLISYASFEALMAKLHDLEAILEDRSREEQSASSRFAGNANTFVRKLISSNRSLFEELAGR